MSFKGGDVGMTTLERRVAGLWRNGRNTKEIADALGMPEAKVDRMRPAGLSVILAEAEGLSPEWRP